MKTAEEFYDENLEGYNLLNLIDPATAGQAIQMMEAYKQHCDEAENLAIPIVSTRDFKNEIIEKLDSMEAFGHVYFKPEYSDFANGLFENIRRHIDDIGKSHGC